VRCTCGLADELAGGSHESYCAIEGGREADDAYWDRENARLDALYGAAS
jgi:hypothetical protein